VFVGNLHACSPGFRNNHGNGRWFDLAKTLVTIMFVPNSGVGWGLILV
jgi:hypothetical protein